MLIRAGPSFTKELLEQKIQAIAVKFPTAKIIPLSDGFKITGISPEEENQIEKFIERKEGGIMPPPLTPPVAQASSEANTAFIRLIESIAGEKTTAATRAVGDLEKRITEAEERVGSIEKILSDKIEVIIAGKIGEINGKIETAITNFATNEQRFIEEVKKALGVCEKTLKDNLAAINEHDDYHEKKVDSFIKEHERKVEEFFEKVKEKIDIFMASYTDEKKKIFVDLENNARDHVSLKTSVAAIIKGLREIPLPQ